MPRTKIPKNSKRNRDASNFEDKINNFERKMEVVFNAMDDLEVKVLSNLDSRLKSLLLGMQNEIKSMKICDFLELIGELPRFADYKASDQTQMIASISMSSNTTGGQSLGVGMGGTTVSGNRNDEGYLTEDSSLGGQSSASALSAFTGAGSMLRSAKAMRTPGPLHSARARRARRSRSAGGEHSSRAAPVTTSSSSNTSRMSRNKMRTPMATRPKAFSADRTPMGKKQSRNSSPSTPPVAFLRYPKPGEIALSKFGSPMVAQAMPDKFANVNIPIRNGVLSLRPKKLVADEVESDLLKSLDEDTLNQIKTLHANLQMIVNTASKAGLK